MNILHGVGYLYLWIAAIGFPACLPWALLNRREMDHGYHTGYDNGWNSCEEFYEALSSSAAEVKE